MFRKNRIPSLSLCSLLPRHKSPARTNRHIPQSVFKARINIRHSRHFSLDERRNESQGSQFDSCLAKSKQIAISTMLKTRHRYLPTDCRAGSTIIDALFAKRPWHAIATMRRTRENENFVFRSTDELRAGRGKKKGEKKKRKKKEKEKERVRRTLFTRWLAFSQEERKRLGHSNRPINLATWKKRRKAHLASIYIELV